MANINSEKIGEQLKKPYILQTTLIFCSARLMRYLATHHVYKELSPDVFTNTRISSTLDTGKSVKELFAK